jgi:membrane-bound metal-dependent hydrolase YbcI (DUF457 family)
VTIYEHIMLGVDGAMAIGLHRRWGWQIVAWSGCAAALPDWDGLTLLLGGDCYAAGHRVWGHNLLAAGLSAVILGVVLCRWDLFTRVGKAVPSSWGSVAPSKAENAVRCSWGLLLVWAAVGLAAAYAHLGLDVLFSYGRDLPVWDVPLLWPFSARGFAYPTVRWGDPVPTIIFAAGMLAMARWRSATQRIAAITLTLVAAYIVVRGTVG